MTHVLVTGGAGAIGSRLVYRLLESDYRVTVVDDLSSGYMENIPSDVRFVLGDITEPDVLDQLLSKGDFSYIFHLAALFANQNSVEHPERDLMVNGMGTLRLAEKALHAGENGRLKRVIYVSSSCVYGDHSGPLSEELSPKPKTPYAITKLLGEYYFKYFAEQYQLPVTTLRLFNSYGPGERPGRYRNVIPNFIRLALKNEPLTITGTGNETRDFTYVEDVVDGIILAADNERALGETFDVATGEETKISELAHEIIRLCASQSEVHYAPRRSWDRALRRCGNIEKARKYLGYEPKTRLEDGLVSTIAWIRSLPPEALT